MTKIVSFLKDESGASAAEYAIIIAVIGAVLVTAIGILGTAINGGMQGAANTITNAGS